MSPENMEKKDKKSSAFRKDTNWKDTVINISFSILLLTQFIHSFFVQNYLGITCLYISGWIIWMFSLYFGFIPFYVFKKKGGVSKGESYIKTTKLVDTGIYAIVRHGQYLAGILWSLALIFTTQHWFNILCGIPVIASDLPAIRNHWHNCGVLVKPKDYKEIAKQVLKVIDGTWES